MTVKCSICGQSFRVLTHTHLKKHNITPKEYEEKYGTIYGSETLTQMGNSQKRRRLGESNLSKREEVKNKISQSVKKKWDEGTYAERINGMTGIIKQNSPQWKPEIHLPTFLTEEKFAKFLSSFQDITKCSRCGREDIEINVHHIDENHNNFLPSNLEPLCIPCHSFFHYERTKLPFITISKSFTFGSAHFLPDYDGKCSNIHGHEWKLIISIKKRVDKKTGMVLDFAILKKEVEKRIINIMDHSLLNNEIENPTAENILIWTWEKLMFESLLKGIESISLWETPTSGAILSWEGMLSIYSYNIEKYLLKYKK